MALGLKVYNLDLEIFYTSKCNLSDIVSIDPETQNPKRPVTCLLHTQHTVMLWDSITEINTSIQQWEEWEAHSSH